MGAWCSVPMERAHACGRHGELHEMVREEVAGSCGNPGVLMWRLVFRPTNDVIVPCVAGLFKNSPNFCEQMFGSLPPYGHPDACFLYTVDPIFLAENARANLVKY